MVIVASVCERAAEVCGIEIEIRIGGIELKKISLVIEPKSEKKTKTETEIGIGIRKDPEIKINQIRIETKKGIEIERVLGSGRRTVGRKVMTESEGNNETMAYPCLSSN